MRRLLSSLAFLLGALSLAAQNQEPADSLVRLMSAKSVKIQQQGDRNLRIVEGPARFLHNNTYLICDTAYWYVDEKYIDAFGNVKILQDETVLSSDKLIYRIEEDLAEFRGTLVQLQDKDNNVLRTRHLDYNTSDSVAVFKHGGALKGGDGQVIESTEGTYESAKKLFRFIDNVEMYMDSSFVRTNNLDYHSDLDLAEFSGEVNVWKDDGMVSSERGEYFMGDSRYNLYDAVHMQTTTREGWADTLYFFRATNDIEAHGNAQGMDEERKASALADHIYYCDSLARLKLVSNAAISSEIKDSLNRRDTLYVGADSILYYTVRYCDIPQSETEAAEGRLKNAKIDPVSEYRAKAASEAEAAKQAEKDEALAKIGKKKNQTSDSPAAPSAENLIPDGQEGPEAPSDSLVTGNVAVEEPDTTKVGFVEATGSVRIFKKDMQGVTEKLYYNDLDSIARMTVDPIIWNERNRQYRADSIYVIVQDQKMRKADLMANAFITIQEDSLLFDQIRGAEMLAYFDTSIVLTRFDVLGGATALFYVEENDDLSTVNKAESEMLSALFVDGALDQVFYFKAPQNDAYPVVQLPQEDRKMKGFTWEPQRRPRGRRDITAIQLNKSERSHYSMIPRCVFRETDKYFPGYMKSVYKILAEQDSLRKEQRRIRDSVAHAEALMEKVVPDSLDTISDSTLYENETLVKQADSIPAMPENTAVYDSLANLGVEGMREMVEVASEEISPADDSTEAGPAAVNKPAKKDTEAAQMPAGPSKAELKAAQRQKEKEARWAELDARDAQKAAVKAQKALDRERKRKAKILLHNEKEAAREQKTLDRYIKKFEKKKAAADSRKATAGMRLSRRTAG